jgi:hypothetical protein
VKAWAARAVVAKKAAVATAAQQPHLALQLLLHNAQRRLRLLRVGLMTWMTTFRFEVHLRVEM